MRVWHVHHKSVLDVAWSPHARSLLATASADGTVRVVDLSKDPPIDVATLRGHDGRVLSVCWSAIDKNFVVSGGEDQTARVWDFTEVEHTSLRGPVQQPAKLEKSISEAVAPEPPVAAAAAVESARAAVTDSVVPCQDVVRPETPQPAPDVQQQTGQQRKKKKPVHRPVVVAPAGESTPEGQEEARTACVGLAALLNVGEGTDIDFAIRDSADVLDLGLGGRGVGLYLEQEHAQIALSAGANAVLDAANTVAESESASAAASVRAAERAASMAMWRGDVEEAIDILSAAGALNGDFVAASAAFGRDLWRQATAAYAAQLDTHGIPHSAALQWLALHDSHAAVASLRRGGLLRDALALASARLPTSDPLVHELRREHAAAEESRGAFESACKAYLAAGLPGSAVRSLARRGTDGALEAAAKVVQLSGAGGPSERTIVLQHAARCASHGEFTAASHTLAQLGSQGEESHAFVAPYVALVEAEELLAAPASARESVADDSVVARSLESFPALRAYVPPEGDCRALTFICTLLAAVQPLKELFGTDGDGVLGARAQTALQDASMETLRPEERARARVVKLLVDGVVALVNDERSRAVWLWCRAVSGRCEAALAAAHVLSTFGRGSEAACDTQCLRWWCAFALLTDEATSRCASAADVHNWTDEALSVDLAGCESVVACLQALVPVVHPAGSEGYVRLTSLPTMDDDVRSLLPEPITRGLEPPTDPNGPSVALGTAMLTLQRVGGVAVGFDTDLPRLHEKVVAELWSLLETKGLTCAPIPTYTLAACAALAELWRSRGSTEDSDAAVQFGSTHAYTAEQRTYFSTDLPAALAARQATENTGLEVPEPPPPAAAPPPSPPEPSPTTYSHHALMALKPDAVDALKLEPTVQAALDSVTS